MIRYFDDEEESDGVSAIDEIVGDSIGECLGSMLHDMIIASLFPSHILLPTILICAEATVAVIKSGG